ncbi:uncharacterized protein LOC135949261 [Calliphora vicina]|uniref:uncharacterized protein LOC135949261 n=1 Tax=Calliphora vicina TaxID=7373 RepID=UPI00325A5838
MKSFPNICIYFICFVYLSRSLRTDGDLLQQPGCVKKYLKQLIQINRNYTDSLEACNDEDNIDRRPPLDIDPEAEIEKHKQTSQETCSDLTACNLITDAHEFFHCHSKTAATNTNKFVIMHLNASSMIIELNDQYDPEEKEILRCQLAAKRKYIFETYSAYNDHLKCLSATKGKCNNDSTISQ